MSISKLLIAIIAFIIGLIPGFFIVFNSVFSDSSGAIDERLFTFLLVIVAYTVLGFIFSYIEKSRSWVTWVSLSLPAIIVLGLYSYKERSLIGLNIIYVCLTLGSAWMGSVLGISYNRTKEQ